MTVSQILSILPIFKTPQDRIWMTVFRPDDSVPVRMWVSNQQARSE